MTTSLQQRKDTAIQKLIRFTGARRGQLSEQYYQRKNKDGILVKRGPYYVWQRWVGGKKHSIRVPAEQVQHVQDELDCGVVLQDIFNELWLIMEQMAVEQCAQVKKKSTSLPKRKHVKPRRRSR